MRRMLNLRNEHRASGDGVLDSYNLFYFKARSIAPINQPDQAPVELHDYIRNCTKLFVSTVSLFPDFRSEHWLGWTRRSLGR